MRACAPRAYWGRMCLQKPAKNSGLRVRAARPNMNAVGVRIGQIIVRDVSDARLRTAFPDCEIAAIGADLQITFKLRDLADTYPLLDRVRQTGATLVISP